jgi:hypothetical protein
MLTIRRSTELADGLIPIGGKRSSLVNLSLCRFDLMVRLVSYRYPGAQSPGWLFAPGTSDDYGLLITLRKDCPGAKSIVPRDYLVTAEKHVVPTFCLLDEARLAHHIRELPV